MRRAPSTSEGRSAAVAGRKSALPTPDMNASAIIGAMPSVKQRAREGRRAHDVADDGAAEAAGAVDEAAEERAEQHRRDQIGEHHRGCGPRRADALVSEQHQRDVAGGGAQATLQVGGEEPARRPLLPPEGLDATHTGGSSVATHRHAGSVATCGHEWSPLGWWLVATHRHEVRPLGWWLVATPRHQRRPFGSWLHATPGHGSLPRSGWSWSLAAHLGHVRLRRSGWSWSLAAHAGHVSLPGSG